MRVLVVDDERDVLEEVVLAIESASAPDGGRYIVEGYVVEDDAEVQAAIRRIETEAFEFVITDMRMGSTDEEGLEILAALASKSVIAIVLTRYASIPNCVKAMRAGAWDYVQKSHEHGSPYKALLDSMTAGYQHFRKNPQRGRPNPDDVWVQQNLGQLMCDYPGEVVAVLYERVIDHDPSFAKVSARVKEQHQLAMATFIAVPNAQADEEEEAE